MLRTVSIYENKPMTIQVAVYKVFKLCEFDCCVYQYNYRLISYLFPSFGIGRGVKAGKYLPRSLSDIRRRMTISNFTIQILREISE